MGSFDSYLSLKLFIQWYLNDGDSFSFQDRWISILDGLFFIFIIYDWYIIISSLIITQIMGIGSISLSISSSDNNYDDRIFGFHLELFYHIFISIIPLIPIYHHLYREGRRIEISIHDLYIKIFIRDGETIYLRMIYYESISLSHWVLFDSQWYYISLFIYSI
jgi:hypothetical protein